MAIKIFATLMCLFVFVMVILSTQDQYLFNIKPQNIEIANTQAFDVIDYELNSSIVKASYEASRWVKYQDKDIFDNFITRGLDYNLSSNLLIKDEVMSVLEGNVSYFDQNKTSIFTQKAIYNMNDKFLYSDNKFKAYIGLNEIVGDNFLYKIEDKELKIQRIKAWFLEY
ncbi:hypothetical protein [Campylobacter insulaenigrae]|uniref:Putative lipooligosaccharide transport system, substrate-binding component (LptC family) n=1 Tax=Campylobacter insulaenigrae NCTC 12927 TaxID=1031564 RepID=A0A0A8H0A9_9BACT|nr:hypothetical protein [Campylobacter insulaenigrae]AJC87603.1 putative lipooligosaccharide transport system, substrate-binding component (LptC family) [Campylobacter insulaenigrae NCTC 12927]VEH93719.1 Uncharacterised protein [Campylobacter insulaenigrae]